MKVLKRLLAAAAVLTMLTACGAEQSGSDKSADSVEASGVAIVLSDDGVKVDGEEAGSDSSAAVYVANDIIYYEEGKDFTYGEGSEADAHSADEAAAHMVVHITQPGIYNVSGSLSRGQIAVDLGGEAEENPDAVVTLVLNGVNITCTVAPAVIFYNVYECGSADTETASMDVDTSAAGANVIIADSTINTVNGSYVARIYKPGSVELSEDGTEVLAGKKLHKYDAAFYSRMTMNINCGTEGTGILNIDAENEGLDSELHLTINGGNINIESGNDGINTNEDYVSVTTINGGTLTINVTGQTGEGDGIDSNGWLVINGGKVIAAACGASGDAGIDSDMGIHINGGTVMATGHMLDRIESGGQNYAVFQFNQVQSGETIVSLRNSNEEELMALWPVNAYSVLIYSSPELDEGTYTLWSGDVQLAHGGIGGMMGDSGMGGIRPDGRIPSDGQEKPELPEDAEPPEGMERPEAAQRPDGEFLPQLNEGSAITLPDGTVVKPEFDFSERQEGKFPQDGKSGRPDGQMGGPLLREMSVAFEIVSGENMFSGVTSAE